MGAMTHIVPNTGNLAFGMWRTDNIRPSMISESPDGRQHFAGRNLPVAVHNPVRLPGQTRNNLPFFLKNAHGQAPHITVVVF